jgi:putative ABC transport system substrate-binding protein
MRRRKFITLLGGAAAAWPLVARAQQRPAMPVVGVLGSESPDLFEVRLRAFRQGLSEPGYVEGRNVAIESRWAHNDTNRLPELAADLVRRQVHVIVALGGAVGARAARAATATIPIVFQTAADPVAFGLVASLNRPGGNLTGVTTLNNELVPKLLQVLHELVPTTSTLALLVNPIDVRAETQLRDAQAAARTLGLPTPHVLHASSERDFDRAFAELVQLRAGGLAILASALFSGRRTEQLAALAMRYGVAAISPYSEFAAAGGLMSYGGNRTEVWRLVGNYTGRILKGDKPADLPVQQPTRIELIINLKTAKALGLTMPTALLVRADEVIE